MEAEYFLTEYLGDTDCIPMKCILKHLFSDFIVKEISNDGTVCEVCSSTPNVSEKEDLNDKGGDTHPIDASYTVPAGITDEELASLDDLLSDSNKLFSLPAKGYSKERRTEIHVWIRNRYKGKLHSKTEDDFIRVSGSLVDRKRRQWPEDLPDYLHLTLSKSNKESYAALSRVAKFLRVKLNNIGFRGTKDRRAITAQRISLYRCTAKRALEVNSRLYDIRLSDCKYEKTPCVLGDLWGNRFNIVLRNVSLSDEMVHKRMEQFVTNGFINYFGTQRFGSYGISTASIGKAIFKKNWEDAVNLILSPRDARGPLEDALKTWRDTGNATLALEKLSETQVSASIEAQILKGLTRGNFRSAFNFLPRNSRSLYIHAFQSLLWNQIVSKRIKECGRKVLKGDIDVDGNELSPDDDIIKVALPMPSAKMQFPNNIVGEWYKEILKDNEVELEAFATIGK